MKNKILPQSSFNALPWRTIVSLSWRNIWRNKRRSWISIASVAFAVFFCLLMNSFSEGTLGHMVDNGVRTQLGHLQLQNPLYFEEPTIDNSMLPDSQLFRQIDRTKGVMRTNPRLMSGGLCFWGLRSRPVGLVGIDPVKEEGMSGFSKKIVRGKYLSSTDEGVMVGRRLSEYLKCDVGDTLVMIGQGYQGTQAAALLPIQAIIESFNPEQDKQVLYATLPTVQSYVGCPGALSSIAIVLDEPSELESVRNDLNSRIDTVEYTLVPWQVLMKDSVLQMAKDKSSSVFILYILYVIVGFGILSMMIMLTNERRHEFGVMMSLGMKRGEIVATLLQELFLSNLLGLIVGALAATPIVYYFSVHPIRMVGEMAQAYEQFGIEPVFPFAFTPEVYLQQLGVVFVITLICMLYPCRKVMKLSITEAIRS